MPVTARERHDSNPGVGTEVESGHDSRAIERHKLITGRYGGEPQSPRPRGVLHPAARPSDRAPELPRTALRGARATVCGLPRAAVKARGQEGKQSSQRFPKWERNTGTLVFHLDADRNRSGTRTEGIGGRRFDARARILPAPSTLLPLMHNRVHKSDNPTERRTCPRSSLSQGNAEALGRIVARTAQRERLPGNRPILRSGQEFHTKVATRISSPVLPPPPPCHCCNAGCLAFGVGEASTLPWRAFGNLATKQEEFVDAPPHSHPLPKAKQRKPVDLPQIEQFKVFHDIFPDHQLDAGQPDARNCTPWKMHHTSCGSGLEGWKDAAEPPTPVGAGRCSQVPGSPRRDRDGGPHPRAPSPEGRRQLQGRRSGCSADIPPLRARLPPTSNARGRRRTAPLPRARLRGGQWHPRGCPSAVVQLRDAPCNPGNS